MTSQPYAIGQDLNPQAHAEITVKQRAALAALLALSEKRGQEVTATPHLSDVHFGGQSDGSCTISGGGSDTTPSDSTYILDPLSDSEFPAPPAPGSTVDTSVDVVVEVVTSTIVDWGPIDGYAPGDSGDLGGSGDGGDGGGGGGDGSGDSWGLS
jgi:hypothetical protein